MQLNSLQKSVNIQILRHQTRREGVGNSDSILHRKEGAKSQI